MHSVLHDHCNESQCDMISDTVFEKLAYLLPNLQLYKLWMNYIYIWTKMDILKLRGVSFSIPHS